MIIVLEGGDQLAREHAAYTLETWARLALGVADAEVRAHPPEDAALAYERVGAADLREDGRGAADVAAAVARLLRPGAALGGHVAYGGLDLPTVAEDTAPAPASEPEPEPTQGGEDHGV